MLLNQARINGQQLLYLTFRIDMSSIDEIFPLIPQIRSYSTAILMADIQAAVTIAFVLIPQAIAYASLAGVTPMRALISAVYPVIFYAIFGASRHLSVGPEALSSVLVGFSAIKEFEQFGGDLNDLAVLLGFLTGVMAIGLSFLNAGFIDSLLSGYMLCGFVTGVATLIIVEQLPAMCSTIPMVLQPFKHFLISYKRLERGITILQQSPWDSLV